MPIIINDMITKMIEEEAKKACSDCQEWDCWGCIYAEWRDGYLRKGEHDE